MADGWFRKSLEEWFPHIGPAPGRLLRFKLSDSREV